MLQHLFDELLSGVCRRFRSTHVMFRCSFVVRLKMAGPKNVKCWCSLHACFPYRDRKTVVMTVIDQNDFCLLTLEEQSYEEEDADAARIFYHKIRELHFGVDSLLLSMSGMLSQMHVVRIAADVRASCELRASST